MRPTASSIKNTKTSLGPNDLSVNFSNPGRLSYGAQSAHSPKETNGNATSDNLARLTQENQYLRTRLEQSKVLLRDITNAAKVNSSQLELMKVYKEQHDAMSKRLADVEAAYLADAERLQQLLTDNQVLQRQVGELTVINNTYCEALTGLKSMRGEMVEAYTKAVISNPTLVLSTDYKTLKTDVQKQLLAGIESSLIQMVSKHDLSHANAGSGTSGKAKSKSTSVVNNSQVKSDKSKSKSRSSSYGTHKRKDLNRTVRPTSGGSKRARSTGSGAASTKVNLDQFAKLLFRETGNSQKSPEARSSLSEFPCRDSSYVNSELQGSKAPENSLTVRDTSAVESGRGTPSISTGVAQSNQSTPSINNPQLRRVSALTDTPQRHDIYKNVGDATPVPADVSDLRPADISLNASMSNEQVASGEREICQKAAFSGHISDFYKQHIRTVTEPLLQSIAGLERDNETLQAVVESKDKEISILKNMLAEIYVRPTDMQSASAARRLSGVSSGLPDSNEQSHRLFSDGTSYSHTDKEPKSTGSIGICTGSGLHMSDGNLHCKDLNISKGAPNSTSPHKDYKIASSGDYTVLGDVEKVRTILQDVEKIQRRIVSETPTARSNKHTH